MKGTQSYLFQIAGLLFFGYLFFLSWIFFKERMLLYDPAFFSFRILTEKGFDLELGRWGSAVSQLLPLWFLKRGCDLKTFLQAYSVSFILIYYIIFLFITIVLKNLEAALILLLTLCLSFRHDFYYATTELHQGLAICVLVWALAFPANAYSSTIKKNSAYFFAATLIFIASYYHQFTFFPLLFMLLYELIYRKQFNNLYLVSLLAFTVFWFFIRIEFLTTSDYEKSKMLAPHVFMEQVKHLSILPSYLYFKTFSKHFLLPLVTLDFICVLYLLLKRKWLSFLFFILFNATFIILNIIVYYQGESPVMYENYYTILGFFCAVPLSALLFTLERKTTFWIITSFILAINLDGIYESHYPFTQKVDYIKRITAYGRTMPEKKYIVDTRNFPWQYGWISWTLPFETLLYSSLNSPDSAVTVCLANPVTQYDSLIHQHNIFLGPAWAITWFHTTDLDHHYFSLPSGNYARLTSLQSDTTFKDSIFSSNNVTIASLKDDITIGKEKYAVIPIKITNNSGYKLNAIPSGSHPTNLSYHIYDEKGNLIQWDGHRQSLETDVVQESMQGLIFSDELKKGRYVLKIDFVTENVRWWDINTKINLCIK